MLSQRVREQKMKFASWFGALVAASVNECGPVVVKDGHFPDEFQAAQKTYSVDHAILFDITYAPSGNFKVLNNKAADEHDRIEYKARYTMWGQLWLGLRGCR